jgi:Phage late-transcription coactivator
MTTLTTPEDLINNLINVKDFIKNIEDIAEQKRIDYLDAVIVYCQQTGLEIETAASFIKSNAKLKARIKTDAENQSYLPKTAKLPI